MEEEVAQEEEEEATAQLGLRYSALVALGQLRDQRSYEILLDWLKTASDPQLRIAAAQGLGELGDERALPALEWAREHDPYHSEDGQEFCVHQAAANAIELIPTK